MKIYITKYPFNLQYNLYQTHKNADSPLLIVDSRYKKYCFIRQIKTTHKLLNTP